MKKKKKRVQISLRRNRTLTLLGHPVSEINKLLIDFVLLPHQFCSPRFEHRDSFVYCCFHDFLFFLNFGGEKEEGEKKVSLCFNGFVRVALWKVSI